MRINPHLTFKGSCEEAFRFYETALAGELLAMMPYAGSPAAEMAPADWQNKIMHAALKLGDQMIIGADSPPGQQETMAGLQVCLDVDTVEEAERIYAALSEGATRIEMPLEETFWAQRFASFTDRFGTPWMINCSKQMG
ncbi:MAG: VOC family protein [Pseudomonadota bacterium]